MSIWTATAVKRAAKRTKVAAVPSLTEKQVQQAVIQLLEAEGWLVVRVHVGMFKGWTRNTPVSMNKGKEGFPDLIAIRYRWLETPYRIPSTRTLFIETKRGKGGKLSQQQEHWRNHLLAQGFEWILAADVKAVQEYLHV